MDCSRMRATAAFGLLVAVAILAVGCGGEAVVGKGAVTGTLCDGDTGEALAGGRVRCEDTLSGELAEVVTDAAGRFLIPDLLTGEVRLAVRVPGYQPLQAHPVVVSGGTVTEVDLQLRPRDGEAATIKGRVFGPGGAAMGARVSAAAVRTRTDRLGFYELHVPRATEDVVLVVEAAGHAPVTRVVALELLQRGEVTLDVTLGGEGVRTLRGMVIDAHDGQPVEGATVTCDGRAVATDAQGGFTLDGLASGPLELRCAAPGYREEIRQIGSSGEVQERVVIPLISPSTGEIAARAVDATTGSPIEGITVVTSPLSRRAVTDARGWARVDHVPTGQYWLEYRGEGFRGGRTGPLYVDPVEWPQAELRVEPLNARIVGSLRDAEGAPVAGHRVTAESVGGPRLGAVLTAATDGEGRFVIAGPELDAVGGRWRLTPEGGSASAHVDVQAGRTVDTGPLTYVP